MKVGSKVVITPHTFQLAKPHHNMDDATYNRKPVYTLANKYVPPMTIIDWILLTDGMYPIFSKDRRSKVIAVLDHYDITPSQRNIDTQEFEIITERHPCEGLECKVTEIDEVMDMVQVSVKGIDGSLWIARRFVTGK